MSKINNYVISIGHFIIRLLEGKQEQCRFVCLYDMIYHVLDNPDEQEMTMGTVFALTLI